MATCARRGTKRHKYIQSQVLKCKTFGDMLGNKNWSHRTLVGRLATALRTSGLPLKRQHVVHVECEWKGIDILLHFPQLEIRVVVEYKTTEKRTISLATVSNHHQQLQTYDNKVRHAFPTSDVYAFMMYNQVTTGSTACYMVFGKHVPCQHDVKAITENPSIGRDASTSAQLCPARSRLISQDEYEHIVRWLETSSSKLFGLGSSRTKQRTVFFRAVWMFDMAMEQIVVGEEYQGVAFWRLTAVWCLMGSFKVVIDNAYLAFTKYMCAWLHEGGSFLFHNESRDLAPNDLMKLEQIMLPLLWHYLGQDTEQDSVYSLLKIIFPYSSINCPSEMKCMEIADVAIDHLVCMAYQGVWSKATFQNRVVYALKEALHGMMSPYELARVITLCDLYFRQHCNSEPCLLYHPREISFRNKERA